MKRSVNLLTWCSSLTFGEIALTEGENVLYGRLNSEILALCRELPESLQTGALLLLMRYAGITVGEPLHFFRNYYAPIWSVIYWIMGVDDKGIEAGTRAAAVEAHAMAMFLHSLDDHLNDGEIRAGHLTILLRSQAWTRMNRALDRLAGTAEGGREIIDGYINRYYAGVCTAESCRGLDHYCGLFREQMATGMMVPALLMKGRGMNDASADDALQALGSFGIAWRLLDDINDLPEDMKKGEHSGVYILLSPMAQELWDSIHDAPERKKEKLAKKLCDAIESEGIPNILLDRVRNELINAAGLADRSSLTGLGDQFRALAGPLVETDT